MKDFQLNETTFVRLKEKSIEIFERIDGNIVVLDDTSLRKLMGILENEYAFPEKSSPA